MRSFGFPAFVSLIALNASVAGLAVLMLPLAIGALGEKGGMEASTLGVVAFLELGAAAVTALVASPRMGKVSPPLLCGIGALLAALGNLGSAIFVNDIVLLLALRPIAGIGVGLMNSAGLALAGRSAVPERTYGYVGMAPCVTALIGFSLAPLLIAATGSAAGIFAFEGALALLNLLAMHIFGKSALAFAEGDVAARLLAEERSGIVTGHGNGGIGFHVTRTTVILCIASSFLLALCDAAVWAFVAPLGARTGIPLDEIGHVLMICAVVGCFGPALAGKIGIRFGLLLPITLGQVAMISTTMIMVTTADQTIYSLNLYARVFTILFLHPIYNGLYARVDPPGRIVAAAAGFWAIGYALGPLIGGQLVSIETGQYLTLGFAASAAAIASLLVTLPLPVMRYRHQKTATHT